MTSNECLCSVHKHSTHRCSHGSAFIRPTQLHHAVHVMPHRHQHFAINELFASVHKLCSQQTCAWESVRANPSTIAVLHTRTSGRHGAVCTSFAGCSADRCGHLGAVVAQTLQRWTPGAVIQNQKSPSALPAILQYSRTEHNPNPGAHTYARNCERRSCLLAQRSCMLPNTTLLQYKHASSISTEERVLCFCQRPLASQQKLVLNPLVMPVLIR